MMPITDIVKKLLIANVAIFILANVFLNESQVLLYFQSPHSEYFQPFQIVTHMFMHGSVPHLLFNMLGLYFFGPRVENVWGEKKFLIFYLLCGFGSLGLFVFIQEFIVQGFNYGLVGASGALYGVLVAFAFLFPKEEIRLIFPPIGGKAPLMVGGFLALDLFLGVGGFSTGIGHFAHIGGALMGLLILFYFKNKKRLYNRT